MEAALSMKADRPRPLRGAAGATATLSLAVLLASLGTSVANVALPALAQSYGAPFAQVQWVVVAYLAAATVAVVGAGRLGDRIGRGRLLLGGLLLFAAASVLAAAAPSLALLVAARTVQGTGAAIMMAMATASIADAVPAAGAGRAMGAIGAASAAGTALGPSLGGLLVACGGWRSVFVALIPLAAAAAVLAHRCLPADLRRLHPPQARPMRLPLLQIVRLPGLAGGLAMSLLVSAVLMATMVVGPFYLDRALGLGPAAVGAVLALGPLVVAATGIPAGAAADRLGRRAVTISGLASIAAGCALLALLPARLGLVAYLPSIAILTFGYALFQTANNLSVMAAADSGSRGAVAGLLNLSRNLGLIAGASGMGMLFAAAAGTPRLADADPAAVAGAMRATFALAALLMLPALALARAQLSTWK